MMPVLFMRSAFAECRQVFFGIFYHWSGLAKLELGLVLGSGTVSVRIRVKLGCPYTFSQSGMSAIHCDSTHNRITSNLVDFGSTSRPADDLVDLEENSPPTPSTCCSVF